MSASLMAVGLRTHKVCHVRRTCLGKLLGAHSVTTYAQHSATKSPTPTRIARTPTRRRHHPPQPATETSQDLFVAHHVCQQPIISPYRNRVCALAIDNGSNYLTGAPSTQCQPSGGLFDGIEASSSSQCRVRWRRVELIKGIA